MKYTLKIQRAIKFAAKTHQVYQDQKRKGKSIPYITHPLTAGMILSLAGASEDVIVAGILHDTIEDSTLEKKVTKEMIEERFGRKVAELVESVTENDKSASWDDRKSEALRHISHFSQDSLLVKSADIISNVSELVDDHGRYGDECFARFHAPKEKILKHYQSAIELIISCWAQNPLVLDLQMLRENLNALEIEK